MIAPIKPAFKPPRIVLPAPALSRRWLAEEIRNRSAGVFFKRLLKRYSPQAYAACRDKTWKGCYSALIRALEPVLPFTWMAEENPDNVENVQELVSWGIPIAVFGVWMDALYEGESPALSLCAMQSGAWDIEFDHLFEAYPDLLKKAHRCKVQQLQKGKIRLPRGCQWVAPWQAAADLYLYTIGQTGNAFLDYSGEEEPVTPAWSIGEINALKREWALGKPRYDAIMDLRSHIDGAPAHVEGRLHTLISVLAGEWDEVMDIAITKAITKKESNRGKAITQRSLR